MPADGPGLEDPLQPSSFSGLDENTQAEYGVLASQHGAWTPIRPRRRLGLREPPCGFDPRMSNWTIWSRGWRIRGGSSESNGPPSPCSATTSKRQRLVQAHGARRASSSAPVSLRPSPVAPSVGAVGILPARRSQIQLLIAGVAVFAPVAGAAFLFTALVVYLLSSSTAVVDKQIVIVWPPASAAGFTSTCLLAVRAACQAGRPRRLVPTAAGTTIWIRRALRHQPERDGGVGGTQ